ncbi:PerC family transcriptional regulator, partial [Escherichia coli]
TNRSPSMLLTDLLHGNTQLLLRRNYCLAQISSPPLPEKLDISEVAKAADATLRRMGIASPSGEVFRKGTPVC